MARKFRVIVALLYLLTASALTNTQSFGEPVAVREASECAKYVTVDQIKATLPPTPVVAGFDIDDTVLFSSPGFYYGQFNHDGPRGTNKYGNPDSLWTCKAFWNDMNGKFDKFSIPKASGQQLILMHRQRGDTIVFITARESSQANIVPKILSETFTLQSPKVIFTNGKDKDLYIQDSKVTIYYGDSDSDITAAKKANARPIRVLRSPLSTNKTSYAKVGQMGEEVLKDSEN
jgi:acid phosphatase (class B)